MSDAAAPVRLGVSACLLGDRVRYDGGHKLEAVLLTLAPYVEWVTVCPEVECGMGTPREPIELVDRGGRIHLIGVHTGVDVTETLTSFTARRLTELADAELCGYIFKARSPSCGPGDVPVHERPSGITRMGTGAFAAAFRRHAPDLPVEDEDGLRDPARRDHFLERVFAYRRLRELFHPGWTIGDLVAFHTAHKLVLMAHSPEAYTSIGRLVADARKLDRETLRAAYLNEFTAALAVEATRGRHANVLQHIAGYFGLTLDDRARAALNVTIEAYRAGHAELASPLATLRRHAREQQIAYLTGQWYLQPDPRESAARMGG